MSLSPTDRTTITRHRERASDDQADLLGVLDEALVCHVGLVREGAPVVLPSIFGVDPDGPDDGGTLYLHGSGLTRMWLPFYEQLSQSVDLLAPEHPGYGETGCRTGSTVSTIS